MEPVLQLKGIVKRFPGVVANDRIDLTLFPGEIHALLGENGAGKSTLMNVLYGLISPDAGEIVLKGAPVRLESPAGAIARGIGMVHQHFMLVPVMTVAENVMLGLESTRGRFFLDTARVARRIREISSRHGLAVEPEAVVQHLPVGVQQRIEIIKVLYREAEILILDEPTAVLTPQEVEDLFEILRSLARSGHSLLFITHKLKEALALADRITVLRRGRVVGTRRPEETSEEELATMMVGRDVELTVKKRPARPGRPVLSVQGLWVEADEGPPAIRDLSLEVRAGEILGAAGVQGNGQTELMEALAGLRPPRAGRIVIDGRDVSRATPREIAELGVGYIPEDRQRDGLILPFPLEDNLILNRYHREPFSRKGWIQREEVRRQAETLLQAFDIRASSVTAAVRNLSGGNQQKVIAARELSRPIKLLLASQPTRGLDVGSIEYIHSRILEARDGGTAVVLVSTELDEILALSDRIAVLYRGRIVGLLDAASADRTHLGLLMTGAAA
ncbi:ABC transporter ATP-binding protein [Limnochorda pilosa]|uniref:ABC transporter ATP-binding protein n=1 Tax=Limnochorda pilosa TaxID=1555112 RepID=UPI00156ADC8A